MSDFPQPLSANLMPRFAGPATMMRLPGRADASQLDCCFVGVPFDLGTSHRSGTRFGPRQIRAESSLLRPCNLATRAAPFQRLRVDDIGDIATNPYRLEDSLERIRLGIADILKWPCRPLVLGGDHLLTLPVLQAMKQRWGRLGLLHVDAHADINDRMFGEPLAHGTPFRRALEQGLIDPARVVQLGIRGTGYASEDLDWPREQGFLVIPAEKCWHRSLTPLMNEVRERLQGGPVYLSFDIDALDPSLAPGCGTPELGGLSGAQALEVIRGCQGLDLVGADLVEVSPPYDSSGNTALMAANLLFEMLCVMPGGSQDLAVG